MQEKFFKLKERLLQTKVVESLLDITIHRLDLFIQYLDQLRAKPLKTKNNLELAIKETEKQKRERYFEELEAFIHGFVNNYFEKNRTERLKNFLAWVDNMRVYLKDETDWSSPGVHYTVGDEFITSLGYYQDGAYGDFHNEFRWMIEKYCEDKKIPQALVPFKPSGINLDFAGPQIGNTQERSELENKIVTLLGKHIVLLGSEILEIELLLGPTLTALKKSQSHSLSNIQLKHLLEQNDEAIEVGNYDIIDEQNRLS